jgi:ABC-type spermidine/putrescine transport system permease subunit II
VTFPLYIYGEFRVRFPPAVNVLATTILVFSIAIMLTGTLFGNRKKRA